jgi:site-specific DNA-methyltransferase (adenine-specific)
VIERGDGWELRLGDCIEGMRGLADDSVDVTITDPPYEGEVHGDGRRVRDPGGDKGSAKYRKMVEAPLPFAAISEAQRTEVAWHIARTTKRWSLVFCQVEAAHKWAAAIACAPFGVDYVRTMVWVKPDGQPQFTGDRPGMGYESIVVCHRKGRKRWNGGGRLGVFEFNKNGGKGNSDPAPHPTTKPLPLMRELVSLFSDPDELILDPFAGSGSTGVACRQLGRRFIGWELNRDYFDIACRRLRGEEAKPNPAQPSLFGGAA